MAPPLFFMLFVALVIIVGAAVAFFGIRAGLWLRETDPDDTLPADADDERFERRPEHVAVDEPGQQRYVGG